MSNRFPDIHAHALQVPMKVGDPWLCFHCKKEFEKPRNSGRVDLSKFLPGECIFIAAAMPCEEKKTND